MKRGLSIIFVFVLVVSVSFVLGLECKYNQMVGDVDGDGIINTQDANLTADIDAGLVAAPEDICCVDIDRDGEISIFDALYISEIVERTKENPLLYCGLCLKGAWVFDIDGNSNLNETTDGVLISRYLFGFTGTTLIENATGTGSSRNNATDIIKYLDALKNMNYLDIDGNGESKGLTDGILISRYLGGITGAALINNSIGTGATRTSAEQIISFIEDINKESCLVRCRNGQKIGDVNDDGKITNQDVDFIVKVDAKVIPMPSNICCADANKDNKLDIFDSLYLSEMIQAGNQSSLGFCVIEDDEDEVDANLTCTDSESINDLYSKGSIVVKKDTCPSTALSFTDTCLSDLEPPFDQLYVDMGIITSSQKNNDNILFESKCISQIPQNAIMCEGSTVNTTVKNFIEVYQCPKGCKNGACIEGETSLKECESVGTIQSGKYCSTTYELETLKAEEDTCDNDYECETDFCLNSKCSLENPPKSNTIYWVIGILIALIIIIGAVFFFILGPKSQSPPQ